MVIQTIEAGMKDKIDSKAGTCRLCDGPATSLVFSTKKSLQTWMKCEICGYIGLAEKHFPSRKEEKNRYLLHTNNSTDSGYLDFLDLFVKSAVRPYTVPPGRILDYGSGPVPVLSGLLKDLGYECDIYDPIFAKTRLWKKRIYSAILLHEVAEHLKNPQATFSRLLSRLETGGIMAVRTRFPPSGMEEFKSWWYRMDPTHVGFFTPQSLILFFAKQGFSHLACIYPDIIIFRKKCECVDSTHLSATLVQ
jgi:hypothetical protein